MLYTLVLAVFIVGIGVCTGDMPQHVFLHLRHCSPKATVAVVCLCYRFLFAFVFNFSFGRLCLG
jgi:hypothetical protein